MLPEGYLGFCRQCSNMPTWAVKRSDCVVCKAREELARRERVLAKINAVKRDHGDEFAQFIDGVFRKYGLAVLSTDA